MRIVTKLFLSKHFARFLLFGGTAALCNLAVGSTLYGEFTGKPLLPYSLSIAIASLCGLLVNFSLNYKYNFVYRKRTMRAQLQTFCVVALGGSALTVVIAVLLLPLTTLMLNSTTIKSIGADFLSAQMLAQIISIGIVVIYSYLGHKFISFNAGLRNLAKKITKFKIFSFLFSAINIENTSNKLLHSNKIT